MLCCGRRWGKTELGKFIAAEMALHGHPVGWFAPEYRFLSEAWRDMVKLLGPYTVRSNATEHRIELVTGGVVEMWSLDGGNAGRSRKYARAIVDEAAMVPALMNVWNDAIRPTLTDLRGDAWFMSTPKGRNDFWQLYQYGLDPLRSDWQCWQMPTRTNPFIDQSEIEAARKEMPEDSFAQEYLAEFLESSAVFRGIREAATATRQDSKIAGHRYVVGVDWGKYNDFSVFSVIDSTSREQCYIDRSNQIEYVTQIDRLKTLCQRFGISEVIAEENANETTIELIRHAGLPLRAFRTTNESKFNIIEALRNGIESSKLKILDEPVQMGELQAFEATRLPGGGLRYAAPEGYHDDCVMALALAWDAAKDSTPVEVGRRR